MTKVFSFWGLEFSEPKADALKLRTNTETYRYPRNLTPFSDKVFDPVFVLSPCQTAHYLENKEGSNWYELVRVSQTDRKSCLTDLRHPVAFETYFEDYDLRKNRRWYCMDDHTLCRNKQLGVEGYPFDDLQYVYEEWLEKKRLRWVAIKSGDRIDAIAYSYDPFPNECQDRILISCLEAAKQRGEINFVHHGGNGGSWKLFDLDDGDEKNVIKSMGMSYKAMFFSSIYLDVDVTVGWSRLTHLEFEFEGAHGSRTVQAGKKTKGNSHHIQLENLVLDRTYAPIVGFRGYAGKEIFLLEPYFEVKAPLSYHSDEKINEVLVK